MGWARLCVTAVAVAGCFTDSQSDPDDNTGAASSSGSSSIASGTGSAGVTATSGDSATSLSGESSSGSQSTGPDDPDPTTGSETGCPPTEPPPGCIALAKNANFAQWDADFLTDWFVMSGAPEEGPDDAGECPPAATVYGEDAPPAGLPSWQLSQGFVGTPAPRNRILFEARVELFDEGVGDRDLEFCLTYGGGDPENLCIREPIPEGDGFVVVSASAAWTGPFPDGMFRLSGFAANQVIYLDYVRAFACSD